MLHYDMIRYEIMYLKMLGALSNTDYSLQWSTYDSPDQFRHLISGILERHFLGDQDRIKAGRKTLKKWAELLLIDKDYFDCFKGTPRALWFAHHYIFEYPVLPAGLALGGLGDGFDCSGGFNSLLLDDNIFTNLDFANLNIDLDGIDWDLIKNPQVIASKKTKRVFSRFYLNAGASTDLYNPTPVTERELINGVMRYIDEAPCSLGDKISYFKKLHERWLEQYDFFLADFDWISRDDETQLVYLWDYLKGKERIAGYLRPYNTSMRYDMVIAAIDVWNVQPEEKLEFIEKMKHAWQSSKSYRRSAK
ncbi:MULTISPECIES: hypothetical protein [Citrobacter]|uniref:Uncharacterized protein n=1 Tax=Citrobacter braakii TaxID=57706 RepID=A0A1V8NYK2_CITBR|nr:hypothetical protein [Citrobacter braakii]EKY0666213.1 hypothetical protein [Citrobacter freundii]MDT7094238.1 hypothetical protein [Citrobacter amalonaticus]OQM41437.1 hypothetical protein BZK42_15710 [Citrobacter braakii]QMD49676.1 hypothetical protein HVZ40_21150 [Citrobacter freundii]QMD59489.1 hypothetical protein HVZ38_21150 [Citrobacter freundii]